jgi:hypothetical protein
MWISKRARWPTRVAMARSTSKPTLLSPSPSPVRGRRLHEPASPHPHKSDSAQRPYSSNLNCCVQPKARFEAGQHQSVLISALAFAIRLSKALAHTAVEAEQAPHTGACCCP